MLEVELLGKRLRLRELQLQHPTWGKCKLAEAVGMSPGWVTKWRRRLREEGTVPRFVGGAERGRDFPAPLLRFLNVLGVEPDICPPRQPFKNPFAERLNRTYKYEGILVYLPDDLPQTEDVNHDFRHHYTVATPHLTTDFVPFMAQSPVSLS